MKRLHRWTARAGLGLFVGYLVMVLSGSATAYVFAASYETVFNKDLPVVDAMSSVDLTPVSRLLQPAKHIKQTEYGNYGRPQYLKLPTQQTRMVLAPAIQVNDQFLARASAGHIAITSAPRGGNMGNAVVYLRQSWRTIPAAHTIKTGENIFIDTDRDWRYFYRITHSDTLQATETYVAQDAQAAQLFLVVADPDKGTQQVMQATLVNVQNVRL